MRENHQRTSAGTPPVTHVIKKSRLESARFEAVDPSLLVQPMRVPKAMVAGEAPTGEAVRTRRLFRGDDAKVAPVPFEIFTQDIETIKPPRAPRVEQSAEPDLSLEEIEKQWRERLDLEVELARRQGFDEGVAAARTELKAQLDEGLRGFANDLNAIQHSWETHLRQSEPYIVQLAFRIARAVLVAPLPDDVRRISETAVLDAVERMASGISVEVILHPVSYLRMQESGVEEQLNSMHSKIRWRTNPEMKPNEWIVQSARSTTRRLEAELLDQIQRDLTMRDMQREDDVVEEGE